MSFKTEKTIGILFIAGAVLLFIPYTILTIIFDYPDILRQDAAEVLTRFHAGGASIIAVWWLFAMVGLPLIPAYTLLGQKLEGKIAFVKWATQLGIIGLIVQMIGLLRWTFVVPALANTFVNAPDEATKTAATVAFQTFHQFGGVLLGEHLGQLFTILWTVLISYAFAKLKIMATWIHWLGYIASGIYLLAQGELLATVITDFPQIEWAGFLGSTLWLVWLIVVGIKLRRTVIN
ncbi:MAG: DUF4386 domain-containing protein [Saprospiraceae bacterium]|nr:DUF4386 domain-containing protein [Saprospiraceae bacterium]